MRFSVRLISPHVFFVLDCTIILLALVSALLSADSSPIRLGSDLQSVLSTRITFSNILRAATVFSIWSLSMRLSGVYKKPSTPVSEALHIALTVGVSAMLLGLSFGNQHKGPTPLQISAHFVLFCLLAMFSLRALVVLLSGSAWSNMLTDRNVLIVGSGPLAARAYKDIRTRLYRSHHIFGFVDSDSESITPGEIASLYRGCLSDLESILFHNVIDEVIIALPARSCYADIEDAIAICRRLGVEVKYTNDLFESSGATSDVAKREHREMVVIKPAIEDSRLFVKRCIDVIVSGCALVVLLPLFLAIAAAIKATSRGPVLFIQTRYGLGRRRFSICKFRTMVHDAETQFPLIESLNEATGPIFKIRKDPRLTKVGAFLRRTSLDELPQLLNVFVGDMALVGPRPMSVRDVSRFSEPWLMRRFSVKPGITCLWQVNGRSNTTFYRWMELDMHYIDNWTLSLDARILALTIPAVIKGHGAM